MSTKKCDNPLGIVPCGVPSCTLCGSVGDDYYASAPNVAGLYEFRCSVCGWKLDSPWATCRNGCRIYGPVHPTMPERELLEKILLKLIDIEKEIRRR